MNKPLTQFICDCCGETINNPSEGTVEWIETLDKENKAYILKNWVIVHSYDKGPKGGNKCSIHKEAAGLRDTDLSMMLNEDSGMSYILSMLDPGPIHLKNYTVNLVEDIREYTDFVRRLTIRYYDEARKYFGEAMADGLFAGDNDVNVYTSSKLKSIIEKYKTK